MNNIALGSTISAAEVSSRVLPFIPDDTRFLWVVRKGAVDVFLEILDAEGATSNRQPVFRVNEGDALFSLKQPDAHSRFLAVPLPESDIEQTALLDVQQQLAVGTPSAKLWLEKWITHLSKLCCDEQAPASLDLLKPGIIHTTLSKPVAIAPSSGVVWVRHKKGKSLFLGLEGPATEGVEDFAGYGVEGSTLFPVSKRCWLMSSPRSVVEVFEIDVLPIVDRAWDSVARFQACALSRILANCRMQRQLRKERVRASANADGRNMEASLSRLASPLAESANYSAEASSKVVDLTYIACYTAAKTVGIELRPHPDLYKGGALSDPIPQIARASGVRFRRVALRGKWWQADGGPMVAFREKDGSPVALLPKGATQYECFDPASSTTQRVTAEVALSLAPIASVFYRPFPGRELKVWDVFRFGLAGCRRDVSTILWSGLGIAILSMALPFATGFIFDSYIPAADKAQLTYACVFLAFIAVASSLLMVARGFATLRLEGKMDASLQAALWDRLLNLPVPFFRDFSTGDLAMRSLGILQIRRVLTGSVLSSILSGVFSVFSLALLFYYSWRLAILGIVLLAFAFLVSGLCGYVQVHIGRTVFQMRGATTSMVSQFIGGMPRLRVAAAESRAFSLWANQFAQQRQLTIKARKSSNLLRVFTSVYPICCQAALFFYHSYLLTDSTVPAISTGAFLGFLAAFTQLLLASLLLSSSITAALDVIPLYERAEPILKALPEKNESGEAPTQLTGVIEANNLTFGYRADAPLVLRGISFRVEPGQFVAFVGASGCGKSTLFRLLLGFETPASGAVYYDEKDLSGLDVQAVRQHLGVVLQSSKLSAGTILSNIVGASNLTVNDAWEAARLAGVEADIKLMPMGMHTVINDGGGGFSGGQRQRLLIARAIANRPRILLFDEATSALDNATQSAVSKSLESFQATRVVIAHRLSTIQNADCIYVLDKGRIVQQGKYAQLMQEEGLFRELARRQIL